MTNKKKILVTLGILSVIIISFIGGQSFSKYIAEIKGVGTAEVATWSFKVNGQTEQVQTINIVSTCDNKTLIDNKIAPGTSGSFDIVVDATGSDVGVDYKVEFVNQQNKPTNFKYIYEGKEYRDLSELQNVLIGTIDANEENKVKKLTINWQWNYETGSNSTEISANDKIDTQDAKNITSYTFDVIVSGVQVMPKQ